jgi:putative ABC transport system permease protein
VAVAMLVVGGVVARGFEALAHDDLGFRADHLLISRLAYSTLPSSEAAYGALVQTALQRLRQIPGVQHVTGLSEPPFRPTGNDGAYALRGDTPGAATNRPFAHWLGADADYFQTLGIALRAGRLLTEDDRRGAPPVAIVDEQLAQQAWPGKNPIGQDIGLGGNFYRVVGVVGTTRYRDVLAPRATVYTTYAQSPTLGVGYAAVRTSVDPSTIIPSLRTAVRDAAPSLYLADFATMNERVTMSLATQRLDALLLAAFAIGILALTSVGLYSVAATFVRYREFEIGVRIALGATPAQVARLVMGQGAVVIVTGVIIGIIGAFVAGSAIGAVSYGASTRELRPIAAAVLVVCTVALVAFAIPGRRAARANAAEVLRRG